MTWLLWREYRLNRGILAISAGLILLSYVSGMLLHIFAVIEPDEIIGPIAALLWSLLSVALLAGNAFAGERADRSIEFVAYLPLYRGSKLASKLLLHVIAIVAILGFHLLLALAYIVFSGVDVSPQQVVKTGEPVVWGIVCIVVIVLITYGVGWLVSSLQSSPALATLAGLATPGGLAFIIALAGTLWYDREDFLPGQVKVLFIWFAMIGLAIAIVSFGIGSWHYLRDSKE